MSDEKFSKSVSSAPAAPAASARRRRGRLSQIWRLATKELKETLRDRRTIVTLIAMPLIVYPILSIAFRTFLLNNLGSAPAERIAYNFAVKTDLAPDEFQVVLGQWSELLKLAERRPPGTNRPDQPAAGGGADAGAAGSAGAGDTAGTAPAPSPTDSSADVAAKQPAEGSAALKSLTGQPAEPKELPLGEHKWGLIEQPDIDFEDLLASGQVNAVLELKTTVSRQRQFSDVVIHVNDNSALSRRSARWLQAQFDQINRVVLQAMVRRAGGDPRLAISASEIRSTPSGGSQVANQFTAIIPLVLVLMTITGAVYPAIDLTAGERERGTLETLVAAPIPRLRILVAKLIAVLTVAVLTASLNVIGMITTIWAFRLDTLLIGEGGLTLAMMSKVFGLLILFAAFFSALLLVVTSFARSFKEAQAYLIPIILLSLGPGLMALSPDLKLAGPMAACPLLNILLLARDVLQDNVQLLPAAVAIFSTVLYGLLAISLAASIFGTDNILYGSGGSWKELFVPPMQPADRATPNLALFCLLLLFPVNFVLIGLLGRLEADISWRLLYTSAFTTFAFCLIPLFIARYQRVRLLPGFGLSWPSAAYLAIAVILGISLWPLVMSLISGWHEIIKLVSGAEAGTAWRERIVAFSREQAEQFRAASPGLILLAFSLTPAFCEEFFFRGLLQRALLTKRSAWQAILFSAVAFGAFHTLSGSVAAFDRLIPTTVMGLVLGWLAFKADSIWPGVILHMLHNAIVGFLAYFQPQLSRLPGFPGENDPLPLWWSGVALGIAGLGLWLLSRTPRRTLSPN
jgi:ABC-type Na+ efflux pump permease subunit/membrane protease YdiL (CAAX protease family)